MHSAAVNMVNMLSDLIKYSPEREKNFFQDELQQKKHDQAPLPKTLLSISGVFQCLSNLLTEYNVSFNHCLEMYTQSLMHYCIFIHFSDCYCSQCKARFLLDSST